MTQEINDKFENFDTDKDRLLDLFEKTQQIAQSYDSKGSSQSIVNEAVKNSVERLRHASFKILVVGEFNRGKSTFINALLGEETLPSCITPTTAVINVVKYSLDKKAVLHFYNPLPKLLSKLTDEVAQHIKKYKSTKIPEMTIDSKQLENHALENYVVIDDPGGTGAEQDPPKSPFELVEVYWPLELCKNNVEIIDSPGLNENGIRSKITENYFSKVDAVIFVTSCTAIFSESEMNTIDSLISRGFEDMFFICNQYDLVRPRDQQTLINHVNNRLHNKTNLKDKGIHFVSAYNALEAKTTIQNEDECRQQLEKAGFIKLQNDLFDFLSQNRAKIKILDPSNQLKAFIKDLKEKTLPQRKKMYEQKFEELKDRFDSCKPDIELEEQLLQNIVKNLTQEQEDLVKKVRSSFNNYMTDTIDDITDWIQTRDNYNNLNAVHDHINSAFEKSIQKWRQHKLKNIFDGFINRISHNNTDNLTLFYKTLDNITTRLNLNSGALMDNSDFLRKTLKSTGFVREVDAVLNDLFYQIGNSVDIDISSYQTWWRQLADWFKIHVLGGKKDDMAEDIADQVEEQLNDCLSDQVRLLKNGVKEKTNVLIRQIESGLKNDLNLLQENVKAALQEMKKDKKDLEKQKAKIDNDMETLKKLEKDLNSIMKDWEKK